MASSLKTMRKRDTRKKSVIKAKYDNNEEINMEDKDIIGKKADEWELNQIKKMLQRWEERKKRAE